MKVSVEIPEYTPPWCPLLKKYDSASDFNENLGKNKFLNLFCLLILLGLILNVLMDRANKFRYVGFVRKNIYE